MMTDYGASKDSVVDASVGIKLYLAAIGDSRRGAGSPLPGNWPGCTLAGRVAGVQPWGISPAEAMSCWQTPTMVVTVTGALLPDIMTSASWGI